VDALELVDGVHQRAQRQVNVVSWYQYGQGQGDKVALEIAPSMCQYLFHRPG
jgi:hypothetical protein